MNEISSSKWWVLASVACGTFMATLDSSIVNIALPTLTKDLATNLYKAKWVVIIYLLVITCLLLPFGKLSDQLGRKRVFQSGYVIFTIGSFFCAMSPKLDWLILARAVQAIGVSMLMANGPAIITAYFPSKERGAALGTLAMVVSAGLLSGPAVGGFLISKFTWPSIFWVNIPIGIVALAISQHYLPKDPPRRVISSFDWVGTFLQCIILLALIAAFDPLIVSISGSGPIQISRWTMLAVAILFGAVFIKVESEASSPLFDFSLLKIRTFWTANLASFLTFVSFSSVFVLMPFFLEEALHLATHKAGLFMTAIPVAIFIVAPISGRLSDRMGTRGLSFIGAFIGSVGLLAMAGVFGLGIHENISHAGIVLALGSIGLATGLFQSPNNSAIMGAVPLEKLGVASALLATVRNLGMVIGTGLATSLFTWKMDNTGGNFVESIHFAHFVAGILGIGAMIASLYRQPRKPRKQPK
ncbi:MAG: MFS transporter [Bdellovibrionota bacterium]